MRRGCKCGLRGCGLGSRAHTVCIPCVSYVKPYTVSGAAGDDGGAPRGGHHPGGSARPTTPSTREMCRPLRCHPPRVPYTIQPTIMISLVLGSAANVFLLSQLCSSHLGPWGLGAVCAMPGSC